MKRRGQPAVLRRYIATELAAPFFAWTAFLALLFFVAAFLRGSEVFLGSSVSGGDLLRFMGFLAPQVLVQALPVALLLSLLLGLGRLAEDRETQAMQALGLSPRAFFVAPLALGVFLTGLQVLLAFTAQPWGMASAREAANLVIRRNLMRDLRPGVFHEEVQGFTLYAERVSEAGQWANVLLFDGRDPENALLAVAQRGEVRGSPAGDQLAFVLREGSIHQAQRSHDEYATATFQSAEFRAGVAETQFRKNRFVSPFEERTPLELDDARREAASKGEPWLPLAVAFHWRLGQLLMPFSFAVVGAPLALLRRGGRTRGFVFALAAFALYYVLARSGAQAAVTDRVPPFLGGQIANLVFISLGFLLMWRVERKGAA